MSKFLITIFRKLFPICSMFVGCRTSWRFATAGNWNWNSRRLVLRHDSSSSWCFFMIIIIFMSREKISTILYDNLTNVTFSAAVSIQNVRWMKLVHANSSTLSVNEVTCTVSSVGQEWTRDYTHTIHTHNDSSTVPDCSV